MNVPLATARGEKSDIIEEVNPELTASDAVERFKHYGLTVVATTSALAFARAFGEPTIWFVLAVLASTLYGGIGPGIGAIVLSAGTLGFLFAPHHLLVFLGAALSIMAFLEGKRRAEMKERQAEELFNTRLTVDSIPAMIDTMTATGETEFFNSRIMNFFGKTLEEMRNWAPLLHPDDRERVVQAWMQSVRTGEPFDVEHRALHKNGSYRWLTTRGLPVFDRNGRIVRWYNLITDIDDRKRAEEALRASEFNFRMMVESIPGMVLTTIAAGELEFANQQMLAFLGKTLDELRDWSQYLHAEDADRVLALYQGAIETGQDLDVEYRMLRVDGVFRWVHCRALPHRDAEGHLMRWYMLLTDIEDLKQAEETARANELKFRLTIDNIPGLAFTCSSAGELEFVNQRVEEFFGKRLDELKDWSSFVHPQDRPHIVSQWGHSVKTGEVLDQELRLLRADGSYGWVHSRHVPFRDADDRVVRWYCLITDIDDRKRAEDALRASERDLNLIVETIPGLVWCAVPGVDEPSYINGRILNFVGKSEKDFVQSGWEYFLHPDDKDRAVHAWNHAVTTGQLFEDRVRFRAADGNYRWFHNTAELGRDSDGQPTRWYGLLIDIDDRVTLEKDLREMQERLLRAAKIATLGELSASIAHEIGQPLAAVVANGHACLRWLSAQPPNLAKAMEAAERVTRDGEDAGEIVRRIRALFKQAPIEKYKLDLNYVIREVLAALRTEITGRDVFLRTDLTSEILPVDGDRVQLQQLLLNLFLNALEAMDPVHDRPRILVVRSHRHSMDEVVVEIHDSGVGLHSPENVFETFFTTKKGGMGMGLAICRSVVEAHDGRLWISSPDGPGTIFSFALPAQVETTQ
ncbi:MAG TPA: PAS domain-containing protein [Bryobacteraceae bacterium]|nr:PAS domain-containing protein [Bryobacteraceae bacterium]